MNLPETTAARNPRSVSDRRSQQCARPGWHSRKRALAQHAAIIAEAIGRHRAAGNTRWIEPHEYTPNAKTQGMVHRLLGVNTVSMTREQWLTPSAEEEAAFDERSLGRDA